MVIICLGGLLSSAHDHKKIGRRDSVLECSRSDDKDREKGSDLAERVELAVKVCSISQVMDACPVPRIYPDLPDQGIYQRAHLL